MSDLTKACGKGQLSKSVLRTSIENIVGLEFTNNNHFQLLKSGRESFLKIFEAISSAKEVICIEFYIFKDDSTGKKLAELLKEKVRQGVKVNLLYDHFGSFLTSSRFWLDLQKAGIKIRVFNPFKWTSPRGYIYRNHKKLLLIDGEKAFTGGFNIADEYHGYYKKKKQIWRDTAIYLEGPIASELLNIFNKSWKTWKGKPLEQVTIPTRHEPGIPVIPVFANSGRARRRMRKLLLYSIKSAEKSIYLTTAYFIPSKRVIRAMVMAARRGVKLKFLLPGESDVMPAFYAGRRYYSRLLKEGVEIYNYKGSVLHAKSMVFDDCWSIIGSANLDFQSFRRNEESNVGILDSDFSKTMLKVFESDLSSSHKINPELWSSRPLYEKVLEKICSIVMKKL